MGTSKSGRYLNTAGSGTSVSEYSLVHSNEGTFTKPSRKRDKLRLKGGGHGQDNIKLLEKYHIKYEITTTYKNGVRVGNVEGHKDRSKSIGNGQTWFPKNWTWRDIKHAGEHVASLKQNRHKPDGTKLIGWWKGVKVIVVKTHGKIGTIFPDVNQKK